MMERTADPIKTHALLVGVERYQVGANWNLNGPAGDVIAFRAWLRSHNVPEAQITSLVSPIVENEPALQRAALSAEPVTAGNLRNALNQLHGAAGDLLFLYWSGHGFIGADEQRRLLFADATQSDKHNLDLNALLQSLRTSYFAGFARQIVVVDACANYEKEMQWAYQSPGEQFPLGAPRSGCEQFVLLGARDGQVARNLGEERRGLYSRELLKEFAAAGASWLPDLPVIAENVRATLAALATPDEAVQTPIYAWYRDWDGNQKTYAIRRPGLGRALPRWKLEVKKLRRLSDALLDIDVMNTPRGRDQVLGITMSEVSRRVNRRDDTISDVINILQTAVNYTGGIESLLDAIAFYEGGSTAYAAAAAVFAECFPGLVASSVSAGGQSS